MNEADFKLTKEITELLKKSGISIEDIHNTDTLTDSYIDYAKDIDIKKIDFGFANLNSAIRGLRTQELMTIIAGTGIGKSALLLNFLMNYTKKTNELTVLFSLEMSEVGIGERIFQIEMDRFGFEIENGFIKKDNQFIQECRELQKSLSNFIIITKRLDISNIPEIINVIQKIRGKKVRLIGVDYIGLMDNVYYRQNEYLRITDNMIKLYSYAKTLDVAIINLSQTSRQDVKGNDTGLSLYSAKGSGEIEQSSDYVLTLERIQKPNAVEIDKINSLQAYNEKHKTELELMKLSIHKNRRGKSGIIYIIFNRKNLIIEEYNTQKYLTTSFKMPENAF